MAEYIDEDFRTDTADEINHLTSIMSVALDAFRITVEAPYFRAKDQSFYLVISCSWGTITLALTDEQLEQMLTAIGQQMRESSERYEKLSASVADIRERLNSWRQYAELRSDDT